MWHTELQHVVYVGLEHVAHRVTTCSVCRPVKGNHGVWRMGVRQSGGWFTSLIFMDHPHHEFPIPVNCEISHQDERAYGVIGLAGEAGGDLFILGIHFNCMQT